MRPEDLPVKTKLIQLAEEAAELSQASLKLIRAMERNTPVTEMDAKMHLLEEIADVMLCSKVLTSRVDDRIVTETLAAKYRRWEERLEQKTAHD